jgi:SAM-dependent methyltransferase
MQESSKKATVQILAQVAPKTILDAPSGNGWLRQKLSYEATVDGIDLFETSIAGYRSVFNLDLDHGIPDDLPKYEAVVCCEGLEHFGNPLLFLESAKARLEGPGLLVITTPNIWYPAARLQFLMRGFFPGFPCLAGRIVRGSHMHIMPWSFPHLYLYLKLAGFENIELHEEPFSRPKHFWERLVVFPQLSYCRSRFKKAAASLPAKADEAEFWRIAGSGPSVFGRHLIVTARLA